jgi:putative copper export protein
MHLEFVRLSLHVLAATIWVGGQLVLASLVPTLRGVSPLAPQAAARAYARIAWPAFGVLVITGIWNAWAVRSELHGSQEIIFVGKVAAVLLSGVSAWLHGHATQARARATSGAATGLFALAALLLGIQLTL